MYIVKAEANHVEKIVDMSIRAFEKNRRYVYQSF